MVTAMTTVVETVKTMAQITAMVGLVAIRTDGDGVADFYDLFPNDASEYKDSDGDGVGDSNDPMPFSERYSSSTDLAVDGSMTIIALLILVLILRKLT